MINLPFVIALLLPVLLLGGCARTDDALGLAVRRALPMFGEVVAPDPSVSGLDEILIRHSARPLPYNLASVYHVRGWSDVEWTGDEALMDMTDRSSITEAVVVWLQESGRPYRLHPTLLVMLWSHEPSGWKLLASTFPPTQ